MKRKIIISLAPVQAGCPIDAQELAVDVMKSVEAGASMCHLHSRLQDGSLSKDIYYLVECFEEILQRTDVVVQASTGGISDMTIEERCNPLSYEKVETASLNGGSTNLGEAIYHNSFSDIRYCAKTTYEKGIIPEIEVFDISMIQSIEMLKKEEATPFREPILYNLVFGHKGGLQASLDSLYAFISFVPKPALWGVTHYGRDQWSFLAAAIAMGASLVRIGFEDSDYLDENNKANYNYELVLKLANLINMLDCEVASPEEARKILQVLPKS